MANFKIKSSHILKFTSVFLVIVLGMTNVSCVPLVVREGQVRADFNLHGEVKESTIFKYQPEGPLFEKITIHFDSLGKLLRTRAETYNPSGEQLLYIHEFTYDRSGYLIQYLKRRQDRGGEQRYEYSNDRRGRVKKERFYIDKGAEPQLSKTRYFPKKRRVKTTTYLEDGSLYSRYVACYDERGKIVYGDFDIVSTGDRQIIYRTYDESGRLILREIAWGEDMNDSTRTRFEYDSVGNRTLMIDESANEKPKRTSYTYTYDKLGNWTEYWEESSTGFKARREQFVEYYNQNNKL